MKNPKLLRNEKYEFMIDSSSRSNLYRTNNYNILSPITFSFDDSTVELYHIYFRLYILNINKILILNIKKI